MTTTPLRVALAANLAFSALCGVALVVSGPSVAQLMGGLPGWSMTALGCGLLVFAAFIAFVLLRLRIGWALIISVLDFSRVLMTLPLIAIPAVLSGEGKIAVVLIAVIVGLLGIFQLRGIKSILCAGETREGTYRHCVTLRSSATPDELWSVVRDLGSIARYSTGLQSSHLEHDAEPAPGAVRVCTNRRGQSWAEEVVSLDDANRSVVLRFRTEAEDFPFPVSAMDGGWKVKPDGNGQSRVEIWWSVRPRLQRMGWALLALMTVPLDRDIRHIVAAMEAGGADQSGKSSARLPALGYC